MIPGPIDQMLKGIAALAGRVERSERRLYEAEQYIKQLGKAVGQLYSDPSQPAAPGTPYLRQDYIDTFRIVGPDTTPGYYQAKRRMCPVDDVGTFADDDEDTDTYLVRSLPLYGDGDDPKHYAPLPAGLHVHARWEGSKADHSLHYFCALWIPPWLGKIVTCNKGMSGSTGLATVMPCTGTINAPVAVVGASAITCQIGKESWGRANDPCYVLFVGAGPPPWLAIAPALGEDTYDFPTSLDPNQTVPTTSSKCNAGITP